MRENFMYGSVRGAPGNRRSYRDVIFVGIGVVFSFAIIYVSGIVIFSERQRELASMRVLGMSIPETLSVITFEQWFIFLRDEYEICAPADGVVGRLRVEEQEMVDPRFSMLTVFRDDQLEVEAEVLAVDVLDLRVDMSVELVLDREGREVTFPGKIIRIAPQAEKDLSPLGLEERRVKVTVAPEIPPDLRLGPGYEVDAVFTTHELADKLVVPKRSLFTDNGKDALFVVEGGRARLRRVTLGFAGRREQVVEEGLEAGDLVILDPRIDGLHDGGRVAPDRFR